MLDRWIGRLYGLWASEKGDVPGWVLIVLMTSALVVAIWSVAHVQLVNIVKTSLSTVCDTVGC